MKLSIIIPAYNEEARLARMLDVYIPFFEELYGRKYELILVVNGSTDQTAEIAESYAEQHSSVICIIEPEKTGKGGAIMLGMAKASGELVGFVDADGATPPFAFQRLVEEIGDADVIIASRWLPDSEVSPKQPLSRRVASRIFNFLVRKLFKLSITDTQCGAKVLKGQAVQSVLPSLGVTRWAFDVDLLFQLRRLGCKIVQTPTVWNDVSGSRVKVVSASIEMFLAIVRLRMLYSPL